MKNSRGLKVVSLHSGRGVWGKRRHELLAWRSPRKQSDGLTLFDLGHTLKLSLGWTCVDFTCH